MFKDLIFEFGKSHFLELMVHIVYPTCPNFVRISIEVLKLFVHWGDGKHRLILRDKESVLSITNNDY